MGGTTVVALEVDSVLLYIEISASFTLALFGVKADWTSTVVKFRGFFRESPKLGSNQAYIFVFDE
jgi:hypothetical protein